MRRPRPTTPRSRRSRSGTSRSRAGWTSAVAATAPASTGRRSPFGELLPAAHHLDADAHLVEAEVADVPGDVGLGHARHDLARAVHEEVCARTPGAPREVVPVRLDGLVPREAPPASVSAPRSRRAARPLASRCTLTGAPVCS